MKRLCTIAMIIAVILIFCTNLALAKEKQPKVFKLGFITGLTGPMAHAAETQKKCVILLVEQINKKGGLNMPWGKIPVKLLIKDDEMKLDVGVRRFRELVEAGCHGVSGSIYNPMAAALNEECKITGTPYIPGCVPAIDSFRKGNPATATYSVAFTPWSVGWLMGDALIKGMGKKTIFWVGRPDSWGHTMLDGLRERSHISLSMINENLMKSFSSTFPVPGTTGGFMGPGGNNGLKNGNGTSGVLIDGINTGSSLK